MTKPDDHTLAACLARVIGIVTKERITESGENKFLVYYGEEGVDIWNPLESTLQMELVEAWLRENKFGYSVFFRTPLHHATIYREDDIGDPLGVGMDPDKKRAFALAVYAMEQSQLKEGT